MPAPQVVRYEPVVRQGVSGPEALPMARWIDNLVLGISTAKTYVLPSGPNPAFGPTNPNAPPTIIAGYLRISTDGRLVWVCANGPVTIPTSTCLTGMGSIPIINRYFFVVPPNTGGIGFLAPNGAVLSIEAWF